MGLYFEDFAVGRVWEHELRRTVTEFDNLLFCTLTHNTQPLHLDKEFGRDSLHGERLVNSIFTLGFVVGVSVSDTTFGTTLGNMGFSDVRFPSPVHLGDTLRAETEVVSCRWSRSRDDSGLVELEHRGYNQDNDLICSCKRTALMIRRPV